jgi:hypothetical protein
MHLEKYEVKSKQDFTYFEFVSEGIQGNIAKIVTYYKIDNQILPIFNLGFGDKDENTGNISDKAVSNNGDRNKVLATVASTVYTFTTQNPSAWIYMEGSTPVRTRLYQMGINLYYDEITNDFMVLGSLNGDWQTFQKNVNYESF